MSVAWVQEDQAPRLGERSVGVQFAPRSGSRTFFSVPLTSGFIVGLSRRPEKVFSEELQGGCHRSHPGHMSKIGELVIRGQASLREARMGTEPIT